MAAAAAVVAAVVVAAGCSLHSVVSDSHLERSSQWDHSIADCRLLCCTLADRIVEIAGIALVG